MKKLAPRVVIDPKVRFGKPTVQGTRITVEEILGFLAGGMTHEEIEREYGIDRASVGAAVGYAANFLTGERVKGLSKSL